MFHTSQSFTKDGNHPTEVRDHVSLRLKRSQNLPLFISLRDVDEKRRALAFHTGMDLIVPQHRRFKEITLELSSQALESFVESQTSWTFDELQSFTLEVPRDWLVTSPSFPPDAMFKKAANLIELSLQNIRIRAADFPWSQLTTLVLTSVSETTTSIQDILRQCTSLQDLVIDPSDFNTALVQKERPVSLPYLTSLLFGCSQWDYKGAPDIETAGLLESLHAPALVNLMLIGSSDALQEGALCVGSSKPPTVSLSMQENLVDANQPPEGFEHMMSILEMLPVLEDLYIHFCEDTSDDLEPTEFDQLLMRLGNSDLDPDFCPKLQDISVLYPRFSSETPVLLINLLESRVAGPTQTQGGNEVVKLRSLEIGGHNKDPPLNDIFSEAQLSRITQLTSGMRNFKLSGGRDRDSQMKLKDHHDTETY